MNINGSKKLLAFKLTKFVHGKLLAKQALEKAQSLFEQLNTSDLETITISDNIHILDVILQTGWIQSRTQVRNLIISRGIFINQEVQTDPTLVISKTTFGNELLVKKGKKHFYRFLIEDMSNG